MPRIAVAGLLTVLVGFASFQSCAAQKAEPKRVAPEKQLEKKVTLTQEAGTVSEFLNRAAKEWDVQILLLRDEFDRAGMKGFADRNVEKVAVKDTAASRVLTDFLKPLGAEYRVTKDGVEIIPAGKKGGRP